VRRLTPEAVQALLARLRPAHDEIVLIGGQALGLWVERYATGCKELAEAAPLTSKDIDFLGGAAQVEVCAKLVGGTYQLFGPSDRTVATGVITTPDGVEIDLVHTPRGVAPDELALRAVPLQSLRVMHPIHILMSRAANVVHIPRRDEHSLKQLRAAVVVVREFVRERLLQTGVRTALRLNEWAFDVAVSDDGLRAWHEHKIDLFGAVLTDEALGEKFAGIRYPQMSTAVLARRKV
jgi:hypothetical protein